MGTWADATDLGLGSLSQLLRKLFFPDCKGATHWMTEHLVLVQLVSAQPGQESQASPRPACNEAPHPTCPYIHFGMETEAAPGMVGQPCQAPDGV